MCLSRLAKKINIYNREPEQITKIDIITTYCFILALIIIIYFYTIKYYNIVKLHIDLCNDHDSEYNCLKSEFINVIVPYIGILFGFTQTLFIISNKIAIFFNYIMCCIYCCRKNPNILNNNTTLQLNRL